MSSSEHSACDPRVGGVRPRLPPKELGGRRSDWLDDSVRSRSVSPSMKQFSMSDGDDGTAGGISGPNTCPAAAQPLPRKAANAWASYQELDRAAALVRTVRAGVCERILSRQILLSTLSLDDSHSLHHSLEDLTIRCAHHPRPPSPPRLPAPLSERRAAPRALRLTLETATILAASFVPVRSVPYPDKSTGVGRSERRRAAATRRRLLALSQSIWGRFRSIVDGFVLQTPGCQLENSHPTRLRQSCNSWRR